MRQRKLDSNKHSVFLLYYHLILVVKYRKKVITKEIGERLREIFEDIGRKYHIEVEEWNFEPDHIHVLFRTRPSTCLAKFINAYKSASSRLIKKEFPELKKELWDEYFWSRSYCLLTSGGAPIELIRQYIQSQGENHVESIQV
ncbi:MAG: IS200/IS605 family transposase [Desulfurococcaceae archaeon]